MYRPINHHHIKDNEKIHYTRVSSFFIYSFPLTFSVSLLFISSISLVALARDPNYIYNDERDGITTDL
jgi:hypothetical protein